MMSKEFILEFLKKAGKAAAKELQARSENMTGNELYEEKDFIPKFNAERQYLNFAPGYICKSEAGRVVKLIQPYDSTVYTGQPEELPAQWGFFWSTDPAKALPFVSIATSPFNTGDCCTDEGATYRSLIDNNTWKPSDYPAGWELVTE